MLPLHSRRPLAPALFDQNNVERLAAAGFTWLRKEIHGLRYRWLVGPGWKETNSLPPKDPQGFTPIAGLIHPDTDALMGLRYSQVAFDFDPSDFLDVADSRPFSSANSGIRDGWIVAERIGVMGDQVVVAAAHRRGPHLFVVSGQCPKEHKKPLMTHLTTLSAGLVVEAEVAPFAGTYQTANLQAPALSFVCPKNAHIDLQQDAVSLRIPFGEHHAELLISQAPMEAPEKALNGASVMLSKRYGQPQRGSIRNAQIEEGALESNNFGVVRSMTLRNGQELCLVVLRSQKTSRTLAVQGLYPGSTQSSRAWMAARFAMSRLVGTLKNENE